ncbi:MAG: lipid-A-disaccharide synthase [Candidatus Binatia bacterium]
MNGVGHRPPRRILMVAGEASGDALGARLAAALRRADPSVKLYGVGGAAMREAGVEILLDSADLSVMGFSELGRELGRVLGALRMLRRELREGRPDLFVPVDFPDFNLPLCRSARKVGVPVFYYVSPQVWAWRRGRIDTIARNVTRMLVLFPFEAEIYRSHGIDAHFVGHPLAGDVVATRPREDVRRELGVAADQRLLALLPGSRRREVEAMLPPMLEAAASLGPGVVPVVAEAPSLAADLVPGLLARANAATVARRRGDTYNLLAAADAALVTSGTATLEGALVGCPLVVAYRMSAFSYALARRMVKVPFIAMPNLLLGRRVVPELVQHEADAAHLAAEAGRLLSDGDARERMLSDFGEIRRLLARPGAADRAAALALELVP